MKIEEQKITSLIEKHNPGVEIENDGAFINFTRHLDYIVDLYIGLPLPNESETDAVVNIYATHTGTIEGNIDGLKRLSGYRDTMAQMGYKGEIQDGSGFSIDCVYKIPVNSEKDVEKILKLRQELIEK